MHSRSINPEYSKIRLHRHQLLSASVLYRNEIKQFYEVDIQITNDHHNHSYYYKHVHGEVDSRYNSLQHSPSISRSQSGLNEICTCLSNFDQESSLLRFF